jgi:ribosomal protein S18 acetylase RimI-like enzyme
MAQYACFSVDALDGRRREDWMSLWKESESRHFFNSPVFFEAYLKAYGIRRCRIFFGYEGGALKAVLPLVYDRVFGVRVLAGPGRRRNYLDKSVLLAGTDDPVLLRALVMKVLEYASLYLAEAGKGMASVLESIVSLKIVEHASQSLWMDLSGERDVLSCMSSGQRKKLLARIRKNERDLDFRFFEKDLGQAFEAVVDIEGKSSKEDRGMALFRRAEARRLFGTVAGLGAGYVGIGILFFRKEPVAHFFGFVHGRTFSLYHTAFADRYVGLGIGKMVTYFLLKHLQEAGFEKADFMRGNTEAKRQFADRIEDQYDFYISKSGLAILWWKICIPIWNTLRKIKENVVSRRRS